MSATSRQYVTEAEFMARSDDLACAELVDGELIVSPSPFFWHQELVKRLSRALDDWNLEVRAHTVALAPLDIRFGPDRILQPDLAVFGRVLPRDTGRPVTDLPVLCVEVLSSRQGYDRATKRLLYAEAGVPEFWAVDPNGAVEVFTGERLGTRTLHTDRLVSPTLAGLELDVGELFREP